MSTPGGAKRIAFVGTVSTSGQDKIVVIIPKELHKEAKLLMRKSVKVTIEEIVLEK